MIHNELILTISKQFGKVKTIWGFLVFILFVIFFSWLADSLIEIVKISIGGKFWILMMVFISLSLSFTFIIFYSKFYSLNIKNINVNFLPIISIVFVIGFAFGFYFFKNDRDFLVYFFQFYTSSNFFFMVWVFIKDLDLNLKFSVKEINSDQVKFRGIIIFLSVLNDNFLEKVKGIKNISEIAQDRISWEMQLRIIQKFSENLQFIYIIGSDNYKSQKGSYYQIDDFIQILKNLGYENFIIQKHNEPIDFENLEVNIRSLELAYNFLRNQNLKPNEILIDITGGQKIQSAAGAFCGLAYDRYFCYISTNNKDNIRIYDVVPLDS
ncbi:MAG: hypothetical protein NZM44_05445 [Candidatus Calescibacterium sp.]|nr:hypothetical protein [Candidatus Calescibacterium sp.]